jgi:hypothetical protein
MRFAVFILSHARANRVETYNTLRDAGYTGKIYITVDDEDSQLSTYKDRLVFDHVDWVNVLKNFHKMTLMANSYTIFSSLAMFLNSVIPSYLIKPYTLEKKGMNGNILRLKTVFQFNMHDKSLVKDISQNIQYFSSVEFEDYSKSLNEAELDDVDVFLNGLLPASHISNYLDIDGMENWEALSHICKLLCIIIPDNSRINTSDTFHIHR